MIIGWGGNGKMSMIGNVIEIILGLCLLPVVAYFVTTTVANSDVAAIPGATIVLPLIALAIAFGLVYKGVKGITSGGD